MVWCDVTPAVEIGGRDAVELRVPAEQSGDPDVRTSLEIFQRLTRGYSPVDFSVRFWDGSVWSPGPRADFTLVLHHPGALRRMFWRFSQLALGEAWLAGDFSIDGDLESSFRLADHVVSRSARLADRLRTARALFRLPRQPIADIGWQAAPLDGALHSRGRDRQSVRFHYDTSNEFFALWLDPAMVYSCAYFSREDESLEQAQRQKLDYVCRKLRLRPGEQLLDIGCGWGGLIIHAARYFGAEAVGVTLSEPQARLAQAKLHEADVDRQCRVDIRDYRDLPGEAQFDKIASIGMVEHVGLVNLPLYLRVAWRLLRPGGAFLLQGVAESPASKARGGPFFADRYIFPDSELPRVGEVLQAAEDCGFEVRDVESLREHYLLTLRQWRRRLEANRDAAVRAAGRGAYDLWRVFLAGSAYRFRIGHYNLYQTLLLKPEGGLSKLPPTRADWYAGSQPTRLADS